MNERYDQFFELFNEFVDDIIDERNIVKCDETKCHGLPDEKVLCLQPEDGDIDESFIVYESDIGFDYIQDLSKDELDYRCYDDRDD